MLLLMLFAHVAKSSKVVHRYSLKQALLKILQYCIHRKTPVLESHFNKVSGLKACDFFKKETPTQAFFFESREIFKNGFFIEDLSIIPFRNFI